MTATPTRRAVALGAAHDRLHLALAAAERAGCTNPVRARGFCNSHYARWGRYGDPLGEGEGRWPK